MSLLQSAFMKGDIGLGATHWGVNQKPNTAYRGIAGKKPPISGKLPPLQKEGLRGETTIPTETQLAKKGTIIPETR